MTLPPQACSAVSWLPFLLIPHRQAPDEIGVIEDPECKCRELSVLKLRVLGKTVVLLWMEHGTGSQGLGSIPAPTQGVW